MSDAKTCKKCGTVMECQPHMFYWRGRFFHGLVCVPCNARWDDPTDSFEQPVSNQARAGAMEGTGE